MGSLRNPGGGGAPLERFFWFLLLANWLFSCGRTGISLPCEPASTPQAPCTSRCTGCAVPTRTAELRRPPRLPRLGVPRAVTDTGLPVSAVTLLVCVGCGVAVEGPPLLALLQPPWKSGHCCPSPTACVLASEGRPPTISWLFIPPPLGDAQTSWAQEPLPQRKFISHLGNTTK